MRIVRKTMERAMYLSVPCLIVTLARRITLSKVRKQLERDTTKTSIVLLQDTKEEEEEEEVEEVEVEEEVEVGEEVEEEISKGEMVVTATTDTTRTTVDRIGKKEEKKEETTSTRMLVF